jgi:uncharacterized protein YjiS (DUF1127 family)
LYLLKIAFRPAAAPSDGNDRYRPVEGTPSPGVVVPFRSRMDRGTSVAAARPALGIAPDFSVLGRIVRAVAAWRDRARADAEARRSMFCLARLDDQTLRDLGLNRVDFYREGMKPRC